MRVYEIPVVFTAWGTISAKAENEKELMEKLNDKDYVHEMPLPYDWSYVEDSYEIDFEAIDVLNSEPEEVIGD